MSFKIDTGILKLHYIFSLIEIKFEERISDTYRNNSIIYWETYKLYNIMQRHSKNDYYAKNYTNHCSILLYHHGYKSPLLIQSWQFDYMYVVKENYIIDRKWLILKKKKSIYIYNINIPWNLKSHIIMDNIIIHKLLEQINICVYYYYFSNWLRI